MAIFNQGFDITLKASDYVKTSTAQYQCVGIPNTTASVDHTIYMCNAGQDNNNTLTSRCALGFIQDKPSANCTEVTVRVLGITKAICGGSIAAGNFVYADYTASTTSRTGQILGGWGVAATNSMACVVLGRALENGSSNSVISIILAPHLHSNQ